MNPRRIGILVVAVVVAAVAAIGLLNYVRSVEDSALDDGSTAKVWVVKQPIKRGTSASRALSQGMIAEENFPSKFRPTNAVVDANAELTGLVAVFDLPANEVLKEGTFVSPNVVSTGITDRLEERGLVTLSMSLDQVRGVSHQVQPGDHVNILVYRPASTEAPAEVPDAPAAPQAAGSTDLYPNIARYVYQKSEVLSVDKDLTPDLGDTAGEDEEGAAQQNVRNDGLVTLAVPPEAVQQILSVGLDSIYLSLVPQNYEPVPIPPFDRNPVLPAEDSARLTPYGPDEEESQQ